MKLHGGITFFHHSLFGRQLTPKVAAVWQPSAHDSVKAVWSSGFRPPTWVEAEVTDPIALLSNPDLVPERVTSSELVYERRLGRVAAVTGSLFWNRYRDLIGYQSVPDPFEPGRFRQQAVNGPGFRQYGGELAFTLRWGDRLQAYGGASLQRSEPGPRSNSPAAAASLALSSRALWRPLLLSVRAAALGPRTKVLSLPGQRTDVPASLSLAALAALEVPGARGLQIELGVTNPLDARNPSPAPAGTAPISELPEAARTFRATVRFTY